MASLLLTRRTSHATAGVGRLLVRGLAAAPDLTPEQIKAGIEKVEKYEKFNRASAGPTSMNKYIPSGDDMHVPANPAEIAALSGMPSEQAARKVVISQRMKKTLQSGGKFLHQWQITWPDEDRWTNPLMGWTSTADPMSNVKLRFDSLDEATAFAQKNGWDFEVLGETSKTTVEPGTYKYQYNFLSKRTLDQLSKEGPSTKQFAVPSYGSSHWFMPLNFHGTAEVGQHGPSSSKKTKNNK